MATGPVVIVPPSQMKHILSKPESEIDAYGPQNETLQAKYTIRNKDIYDNQFHFNIVRKQLTKNLATLTEDIAEELAFGFEHCWGTSTAWTTVGAWESVLNIVARAANRVFVGTALCSFIDPFCQTVDRLTGMEAATKSSLSIRENTPCPYSEVR